MYKVIFADDEARFRSYFKCVIDWNAHGFELCGEAKNGLEALKLVEEKLPDIAIVDINMPYMNGMELAAKVKESYPSIFVVLVTGHSEFEYARKAVKIGVDDYILKPFDEEELLIALAKIKSSMEKLQSERDKTQKERLALKESFLNLLISNDDAGDSEMIVDQMNLFEMQRKEGGCFRVISVEIDGLHEELLNPAEVRLRKSTVSSLLGDLIQIAGKHHIFNGPENRIIMLLQYAHEESSSFSEEGFVKLNSMVRKHFGFTVTVGAGRAGSGLASIRQSYKESVIALRNRISMNMNAVLKYEDIVSRSANIGFYPSEMNENLLIHLRLRDEDRIKETLDAIQNYIRNNQLSGDYIHMILAGLVSLCLTYVHEIGKHVNDIFPDHFSPFEEITNQPSLEAAFEWMNGLYMKVMEHSKSVKRSKSNKILTLAREHIDTHYADSQLKVEDISRHFLIQPRYLLKIFKDGLGMSVSDYIVETRMKRAKELLSSGQNLRLSSIAEMVGYSDLGHFSKTFKKHTGLSPSEYEVTR
ncbi:response regulator [Paenibacillus dokdonensis]|uniref:Response regulator n=1 Tax=Paenibacillus dokdonensis TaxID=2567944 RepID=A0ABU6GWF6_9BACL|nr:response regulator [Paenibacillus dokdonensis]MEC0244084.1 response regulator [Paenibacillus dokdonensis]